MPNFSQIGQDMAILAHLAKLTDQLTNQPTTCYEQNDINCLFLNLGPNRQQQQLMATIEKREFEDI